MVPPFAASDTVTVPQSHNTSTSTSTRTSQSSASQAISGHTVQHIVASIGTSPAEAALMPQFALPRELRDKVYEYVLAIAGTLFLGIPPHPTMPKGSDAAGMKDSSMDTAQTLVDVRFQQKFAPLPLLGVNRATREEFLKSMARYIRAGESIFFSQEPDFELSRALLLVRPQQLGSSGLISCLTPYTLLSYSPLCKLFLDAMCLAIKWQSDHGLLIQNLKVISADTREIGVRWDCRKTRDAAAPLIKYELVLYQETDTPPLYTFQMGLLNLNGWSTHTMLAVYLREPEGQDKDRTTHMRLKHEVHDDEVDESQMIRSQAISNADGATSQHIKTPGDVLVLMMQDTLSHYGIQGANVAIWPIYSENFANWIRRVGTPKDVSLLKQDLRFRYFWGTTITADELSEEVVSEEVGEEVLERPEDETEEMDEDDKMEEEEEDEMEEG